MTHVLVICARRYNGHELWTALGVMEERDITFEVISSVDIIRDEITMKPNRIKRVLNDLGPEESFDGLMIVSGNMADTEAYWREERVLRQVRLAQRRDNVIAAICCSVPTIREAARDKRVSFFPLVRSRILLEEAGAILTSVAVSVDGKLVTAEHQMATQMWAGAFCNLLKDKPHGINLVDSGYVPKGRERKPIPVIEEFKKARKPPTADNQRK